MYANQTRAVARKVLQGKWGIALLTALVAVILGGVNAAVSPSITFEVGGVFDTINSSNVLHQYSLSIPFELNPAFAGLSPFFGAVVGAYGLIVLIIGGAVRQGLCQFNINLIKKDAPAEFGTLFSKFPNLGKCFLLNLVTMLLIFAWSLLLVVPGIIAIYRYALAPYIMAQNPDIDVMEAINQSKELMRGHKGRLFLLDVSFIGWAFLSAFTFGIGFLWLNPYREAAWATFYLERTNQLPSA